MLHSNKLCASAEKVARAIVAPDRVKARQDVIVPQLHPDSVMFATALYNICVVDVAFGERPIALIGSTVTVLEKFRSIEGPITSLLLGEASMNDAPHCEMRSDCARHPERLELLSQVRRKQTGEDDAACRLSSYLDGCYVEGELVAFDTIAPMQPSKWVVIGAVVLTDGLRKNPLEPEAVDLDLIRVRSFHDDWGGLEPATEEQFRWYERQYPNLLATCGWDFPHKAANGSTN